MTTTPGPEAIRGATAPPPAHAAAPAAPGWTFAAVLAAAVLASRAATTVPVFFVDGPQLVHAIQTRSFVIQPPGYWLLLRTAGLFPRAELGLALVNWSFSAAGAAAFYFLARRFAEERVARVAAVAYATVYLSWFAGSVHGSHASQLLFPPLLVLAYLRYRDRPGRLRLAAIAAAYAAGAGYRPSDGLFLAPLAAYLALTTVPAWRDRLLLAGMTAALCLAWWVPTQRALGPSTTGGFLGPLAEQSSVLLAGVNKATIANVLRVVVAAAVAFFPVVPALAASRGPRAVVALWIVPGALFLVLVHMADAIYLCFLTGGVLLWAATASRRLALAALAACAVWNAAFFLAARPVPGGLRPAALIVNYYAVRYGKFGLDRRWSQTISDAIEMGRIDYPYSHLPRPPIDPGR